jgi:hypothetical protein
MAKISSDLLEDWAAIAKFLGLSSATAHRWARAGMPIRREGRFTVADRAELEQWIGHESDMPKAAHLLTKLAKVDESAAKQSIVSAADLEDSIEKLPLTPGAYHSHPRAAREFIAGAEGNDRGAQRIRGLAIARTKKLSSRSVKSCATEQQSAEGDVLQSCRIAVVQPLGA